MKKKVIKIVEITNPTIEGENFKSDFTISVESRGGRYRILVEPDELPERVVGQALGGNIEGPYRVYDFR